MMKRPAQGRQGDLDVSYPIGYILWSVAGTRLLHTGAGRSQPIDFLAALPVGDRAAIVADVEAYRLYRQRAPVSSKMIEGHRPMFEIRTGGFRAYCVIKVLVLWVLHIGRKQNQRNDILVAAARMKLVLGG